MTRDRTASLLFLAVGIYGFFYSLQLPMGRWNEPGPGVFPIALSILLLVSGVSWFILGRPRGADKDLREKVRWGDTLKALATPLKITGVTALLILVFHHAGYLVSATLYLFVLLFWVSRYRFIVSLPLALAIGVGSWYFFHKLLSVQLPKGLLFL
ncbi:MAG: tripartite tricarboxylate transporter TctB family protein [Thermodesulfobacteriota bacterium]